MSREEPVNAWLDKAYFPFSLICKLIPPSKQCFIHWELHIKKGTFGRFFWCQRGCLLQDKEGGEKKFNSPGFFATLICFYPCLVWWSTICIWLTTRHQDILSKDDCIKNFPLSSNTLHIDRSIFHLFHSCEWNLLRSGQSLKRPEILILFTHSYFLIF